jgi:hypothetical protein
MTEPKNLPDTWRYQESTNSVVCGGCMFRYGAEHPDGDGKWTCPNCGDGNGKPAAAPSDFEVIFGEACDEIGCTHDNEALLQAIADLKKPSAAPLGREAMFDAILQVLETKHRMPTSTMLATKIRDAIPAVTQHERGEGPVSWRWRARGATEWIYDPTDQWREEHLNDDIEFQPLYAVATPSAVDRPSGGQHERGPSVSDYVRDYEYRGDQDYKPNENEQAVIEDAIEGYLSTRDCPVVKHHGCYPVRLLLCPFCQSKNIDPTGWASTDRSGPACDDCGATAETVEIWNTRHTPSAVDREAVIEECAKVADAVAEKYETIAKDLFKR